MTNTESATSLPKEPHSRISVFVTILSLFLLISVLIGVAITAANYWQLEKTAEVSAAETFAAAIQRVDEKKNALFGDLILVTELFSDVPAVARTRPPLDMDGLLPNLFRALLLNPHMFQVYAGYENGDFYQVFSLLPDDKETAVALDAPAGSRFAVHTITLKNGVRDQTWRFYTQDQTEIDFRQLTNPAYDPRKRDWYQSARAAKNALIRTPPYVFAISSEIGLSFAKSFDGPLGGVFATDITMTDLSGFLQSIRPNSLHRVLIFDQDLTLLAHPDPSVIIKKTGAADDLLIAPAKVTNLEDAIVQQVLEVFKTVGPFSLTRIEVAGEEYYASIETFPNDRSSDYIFYAAPISEFAGYMEKAANQGLLAGLIVFSVLLPLIIILARLISRPLVQLSQEAELIQSFQLDDPIVMTSPVREIGSLIHSMTSMKQTVRSISKYVPKALVRDILKSGTPVEVGGEMRRVSLMFTDVQDFTPISEGMTPENLMISMSEYFEELVSLVIKEEGTVDKFVGDAIFAYWNAPLPISRYEYRACLTALICRVASQDMSDRWQAQGRTGWYTRIGVHVGEVVVGNVGSSDRIDFTAIGDAVNIAARLEGLNKYYGTGVLVSGDIYTACCDDILFRLVDHSLPKGAGVPLTIYEPLGLLNGPKELSVTQEQVTLAEDWSIALNAYTSRDWTAAMEAMTAFAKKHPGDKVVQVYIERIAAYELDPPDSNWDGVTRFTEK
ncbi:MAG: adenylate/guanylate cyclase domain-containing protein [Rhodospirillaceae bacterium]